MHRSLDIVKPNVKGARDTTGCRVAEILYRYGQRRQYDGKAVRTVVVPIEIELHSDEHVDQDFLKQWLTKTISFTCACGIYGMGRVDIRSGKPRNKRVSQSVEAFLAYQGQAALIDGVRLRCIKGALNFKYPIKYGKYCQVDIVMGEIDR